LAIAHPPLKHQPHCFIFVLAAFTKKLYKNKKQKKKIKKEINSFVVFLSAVVPRMYH